jgi:AraC-like DNA-binding protein
LDDLVPALDYFIDRACLPEWKIGFQTTVRHNLTWVVAGRAIFRYDGVRIEAGAGDLLYLPPGSTRQAVTDPEDLMRCYACDFQCRSLDGPSLPRLPLPARCRIGFPDGLLEAYRRLNRVWLEKKSGWGLEARGLFCQILHILVTAADAAERGGEPEKRLALVQDYIFHHYAEPVSVPGLAALVRLTPRYFGNWFSERTGMTVKEYVNRIRIRKATDLLATGGFNVAEAAYRSGFDDVFYFSKVFKRIAGHPPSDLIRSASVRGEPIPD